jgi:hypothetical protein
VSVLLGDRQIPSWTILTSLSYVSMPLSTSPDVEFGAYDYAGLSQSLAGGTVGQVYFLTVQVNLPELGGEGYCSINFVAGSDSLVSYNYGMSAQYGSVNASGILKSTSYSLDLSITCSDYSGNPTDTSIAYDNVQLSVYDPSVGTNPILPVRAEGVVNNNFESGSLSPWITSSTIGRMDFAVVNGRATITYSRIHATFTSPSWIYQTLAKPAEEGQNVRIQADVFMNIPNAGTKCIAQIYAGSPVAWSVSDVASSQSWHVDVSLTLSQGSAWFYMFGSCTGTGASTSISFDNVYFTMNAF